MILIYRAHFLSPNIIFFTSMLYMIRNRRNSSYRFFYTPFYCISIRLDYYLRFRGNARVFGNFFKNYKYSSNLPDSKWYGGSGSVFFDQLIILKILPQASIYHLCLKFSREQNWTHLSVMYIGCIKISTSITEMNLINNRTRSFPIFVV